MIIHVMVYGFAFLVLYIPGYMYDFLLADFFFFFNLESGFSLGLNPGSTTWKLHSLGHI